jgi:probable phosphoglycerate mutase
LLLIRHGETQWNVERRYQGQLDSPLTERGIAQAEAIGRRLAELPEFASAPIIASPLGRARRTAEIICANRRSTAFETDDRLREITLGSWDGLFADEIAARSPGLLDKHGPYEWYFHSADGERYDVFEARLASFLHDARARSIFVIVAHGVVSRVLRGRFRCRRTAFSVSQGGRWRRCRCEYNSRIGGPTLDALGLDNPGCFLYLPLLNSTTASPKRSPFRS